MSIKRMRKKIMVIALVIGQVFIIGACHKRVKSNGYNLPPAFAVGVGKKVMEQEEPVVPEQDLPDFSKLLGVNPDTVGWLVMPGTKINYPIVQAGDNDTYLHTGFNGGYNAAGSIFLDYESKPDMIGTQIFSNPYAGQDYKLKGCILLLWESGRRHSENRI